MNELRRKVGLLLDSGLPREGLIDLLIDVVVASAPKRVERSPRNGANGHPKSEAANPDSGAGFSLTSESVSLVSTEPSAEIEERTKPEYSPDFVQFWALYPKKVGKADAWRAWKRHRPPLGKVRAALAWQTKLPDWNKDDFQFVPYPEKYINRARWQDEPPRQLGPVLTDRERRSLTAAESFLARRREP